MAERNLVLTRVIQGMLVIAGAHFFIQLTTGGYAEPWKMFGYVVFCGMMLFGLRAISRGGLGIAGWTTFATLYLALTSSGLIWGGVQPGTATGFFVFVLVSGFTLGARVAGIAAGLSTLTLAGLTALEATGHMPPAFVVFSPVSRAAMVAFSVVQGGLLIWYGLRRFEMALRETELQENETRRALEDLTATRSENERRASQGETLARLAEQLVQVTSPQYLHRDAVEAVGAALGVSSVALLRVGNSVESEYALGLESLGGKVPCEGVLKRLATSNGPEVLEGTDEVVAALSPLFKNIGFPKVITVPVRTRTHQDLLMTGISRDVSPSELSFLQTAADLLGSFRDRHRVEAELRQAQKMEVVGQIAGGVAHDFNNLLSAILGSAELMKEEVRGDTAPMVDNIIRAGEHATLLTRQLLAFSRQHPETIEVHDLKEVVTSLGRLLGRLTGDRVLLFAETCDEAVPVAADRGSIEQILFNLVTNARDAIIGNGEVRISLRIGGQEKAVLTVSDTGCGMPPNVAKHIFDPFFTTKMEGRGTGLGLATVRRIVDEAGGTIEVDTSLGQGTTFTVRLPLSSHRVDAGSGVPVLPSASPFQAHILLLDDNDMVRQATRAMLEKAGHRVTEGTNGEEGAALVFEADDVNLILSDVVMPGMGGVDLLDELRARGVDIPVILMTGYTDPDLKLEALEDASNVLRKPVRYVELLNKVNEALVRPGDDEIVV